MPSLTEFRLVPPHVGAFVKTEIIEHEGLKITQAAEILGVTRQALSAFLNEKSDLSPDMALRIEKAFGVKMDTLMNMQASFDIAKTRVREDEINILPYVSTLDRADISEVRSD